ncbi:hypothetical protein INS49_009957 [Diaporthe citri]|uniref:uncharacterized protein n=1 Tax=Diaporthe citri TaxID=83186 RepID=UPI001C82328F|nr:uncharacterized protein INS49_009957 [Diaporthe citri]KAG6361729.1 hypothetical protein INS49_009957 [Diaporthe citri]
MVIASHYLWNTGSQAQKSHEALFQTLLFHVLRKTPKFSDASLPVKLGLQRTLSLSQPKALVSKLQGGDLECCFCFFIDRLNEYHGPHSLRKQDFTGDDISAHFHEKAGTDVKLQVASIKDPEWLDQPQTVADRAEGTWIWVHFVVRDLVRNIRDNKPFEQFHKRIDSYLNNAKKRPGLSWTAASAGLTRYEGRSWGSTKAPPTCQCCCNLRWGA